MSRRVFITGSGIISSIGNNTIETTVSLLESIAGTAPVSILDTIHKDITVAEVKYSNQQLFKTSNVPPGAILTRSSLLGIIACGEAIRNAGIHVQDIPTAFISATTVGGMDISEQYYLDFLENDKHNEYISTYDCAESTYQIAEHWGLSENLCTLSTACSSSANAIIYGARLIKNGLYNRVIAGGTECLTKFHLNGFNALSVLDKEPCKPFDKDRNGINLGEAAAFLVLESEETAFTEGKTIYAEITGYSNVCEAFHPTASSDLGNGAYEAMTKALQMAGLHPCDISYINAHGTGTLNNDASEGMAIHRLFGPEIPPFSSTKSFTGHTTSAAGAVEAIISLLAMQHSFLPPNLNFQQPMDEPAIRPITEVVRDVELIHVMSNSFGFGGNNSCLIFSKSGL